MKPNEHLIIVCQNLIDHEYKVNFFFFGVFIPLSFDLETIGVS